MKQALILGGLILGLGTATYVAYLKARKRDEILDAEIEEFEEA
jgi:hypothetical protein